MTDITFVLARGTFAPMLRNLAAILDKAEAQARAAGKVPDAYVDARLAPDMFTLAQQVQFVCFGAVTGLARLTGQPASTPGEPDKTFAELKARVARTVAALDALPEADFDGAADRDVVQPLLGTRVLEMKGLPYLRDWLMPHFYFHLVTAYDILRNQGVDLGKRDYVGHLGAHIRDAAAA
jgi:hypothetical protein